MNYQIIKKNTPSKTILIFFCALLFLVTFESVCGDSYGTSEKKDGRLADSVGDERAQELAKALSDIATFEISRNDSRMELLNLLKKDRVGSKKYKFSARKPVLHFTLVDMEYLDQAAAIAAFEELFASSDPDIGLTYSWDYVVIVQQHLYWISGAWF